MRARANTTNVDDLASNMAFDKARIGSLELVAHRHTQNVDAAIASINSTISTINGQVSSLTSQVSTLNSQVSTLNSQVSSLNSQVSSINSQISTINGKITTIEGDINNLENDVAALQPTVWYAASLIGSWVNVAGQQAMQYRKWGDTVWLRGLVQSGASGSAIFNLPSGFRPPYTLGFAIASGLGTFGQVNVEMGGNVTHVTGNTALLQVNLSFAVL